MGETKAGNLLGSQCIEACVKLKKTENRINGVKVYTDTSRKGCWCEKKMKSIDNGEPKYKTCLLLPEGEYIIFVLII